nr:unnamed protein product [Spirometra erinaceieuropaei]
MTNGVKQGCVLMPPLLSLMLSGMLMDAYNEERPRDPYRLQDGRPPPQPRRMHFQSHLSTTAVHELLFDDDCALNATSEGDMQSNMDPFATLCDNFGLVINTEKTVVMHQPPPDAAYVALQINANETQLRVVDNLTCLGNILSFSTKIDDEVARRTSKGSQVFGRLGKTLWNRHSLHLSAKLKKSSSRRCYMESSPGQCTINLLRRLSHFHLSCL